MSSQSKLARTDIVRQAKELMFTRLDDEFLAIDSQSGYCYSLNEAGGEIWELIKQPTTVGSVCDRLQQEYTVDAETCLDDVSEVLLKLKGSGLALIEGGLGA